MSKRLDRLLDAIRESPRATADEIDLRAKNILREENQRERDKGRESEERVKRVLEELGYEVRHATRDEDRDGFDLFASPSGTIGADEIALSVKSSLTGMDYEMKTDGRILVNGGIEVDDEGLKQYLIDVLSGFS